MICHSSLAVPSSSTLTPSSYSLNIITGEYRIIPINIKIKQFCLFDNCYVSKYQNPQMQTNGIKVTPNWSKAKLKKNIKISPKCSAAELSRSVPQLTSRRPSAASSIGIGYGHYDENHCILERKLAPNVWKSSKAQTKGNVWHVKNKNDAVFDVLMNCSPQQRSTMCSAMKNNSQFCHHFKPRLCLIQGEMCE